MLDIELLKNLILPKIPGKKINEEFLYGTSSFS